MLGLHQLKNQVIFMDCKIDMCFLSRNSVPSKKFSEDALFIESHFRERIGNRNYHTDKSLRQWSLTADSANTGM